MPIQLFQYNVVAGALAQNYPVGTNLILNFASRFGALFDEFCIVGAEFEVKAYSIANPSGFLCCSLDEKTASAPTAAVLNGPRLDIPLDNYAAPIKHQVSWVAKDYSDLQWVDIGSTSSNPVNLKLFCSVADTLTSGSTTAIVNVAGTLAFCFRGYKNT